MILITYSNLLIVTYSYQQRYDTKILLILNVILLETANKNAVWKENWVEFCNMAGKQVAG